MEEVRRVQIRTSYLIRAKLEGLVQAIGQLSHEERGDYPGPNLGEDFNVVRRMIIHELAHLKEFLPPEVDVAPATDTTYGRTRVKYSELLVYCRQMLALVNTHIEAEGGPTSR